jgi:hypothetical protein
VERFEETGGPARYARILRGEQQALAVDHILDALPVTTGTRARRPEPELWAGQRLGAQVLGKVQIRNAKELIREIVSVDQHGTGSADARVQAIRDGGRDDPRHRTGGENQETTTTSTH